MRRLWTTLIGLTAAFMGLMLVGRSNRLWRLQMGFGELSWVPALISLRAIRRGWRDKHLAGIFLGGIGFSTALWPVAWLLPTLVKMEAAMQRGLGTDYALSIPQAIWPRIAPVHWSPLNALGWRSFTARATVTRDLVYAQPGVRPLRLDIYQPQIPPAVGEHYPAILALHPGGWRAGDKGGRFAAHHRYLASQGYVVIDAQYRLSQEALWPAALDDAFTALDWLRDHAHVYQIDPQRITLMGRSAGGQLALSTAYHPDEHVQAVISIYGPTDFRLWNSFIDNDVTELLGGSAADHPQRYRSSSPVEAVRDNLPPTLLIHGLMDEIVPVAHAEGLANRLASTNTPTVLLRIPWARHGFDALLFGLGAQVIQYNLDRFLAWSLCK
jgi:acetyl esterase/lipase